MCVHLVAYSVFICVGTGVPSHSAGDVGMYMDSYVDMWCIPFAMRMCE